MAHVLYVAWGFPPHRGPGTYRPLATVNELARRGHDVTVLTADTDAFDLLVGADHSLVARIDPRVRLHRVRFAGVLHDPLLDRWPPARVADPPGWRDATVEKLFATIPDAAYAPWLTPALAAATRIHERQPVDLTIATGNPYVDFAVAWSLFLDDGVPFVVDDRDSWLLDVYTGEPQNDAEAVLPWLRAIARDATQVWFVNPPIAQAHERALPEVAGRIRVVENGWDPSFLDVGEVDSVHESRTASDPLRVAFVGTVSPALPLRTMAEAFRTARASSPALAGATFQVAGQLGHAGLGSPEQRAVAREFADDGVQLTGRVPKDRIHEVYANADVLVFAKEGGGLVTSGKVYEYLATGLPVASMIEAEHDARRVLTGYPRWHNAGATTAPALAEALVAAAADARTPGRREAARAHAVALRRDVVLRRAFDELEAELGWEATP
jgi:glycosyltransferase involved in cell wall biosynthesis